MIPTLQTLPRKQLAGKRIRTSLAENRTYGLWNSFMPQVKELAHRVGHDLFSVRFFDSSLSFDRFGPHTPFDEWAAAEILPGSVVPEGLETLLLPESRYAVFLHRGPVATAPQTLAHIYGSWLPGSEYEADNRRAHLGIMGPKYNAGSPDSEEEFWIPIKAKENSR